MQTNTPKIQEDEIDFGSLGQKFYQIITYPFRLFTSYPKTSISFFIAAIILAMVIKLVIPKAYTSSFIIRPVDRTERFHLKILADLQSLIKYRDYEMLARELKADSNVVRKLVALQTSNASLKEPTDSINCTEITLVTTDYNQFIPLQAAILNYLEQTPYFLKIKTLQKKEIELQQPEVEKDLKRLDSLKTLQLREHQKQDLSGPGGVLLNDLVNPMTTYNMAIDRMNKKMDLIARSAFEDSFQLIKGCVVMRHPSFPPRILVMCLYFVPFFMLLCFFYLHIKTTRSRKTKSVSP